MYTINNFSKKTSSFDEIRTGKYHPKNIQNNLLSSMNTIINTHFPGYLLPANGDDQITGPISATVIGPGTGYIKLSLIRVDSPGPMFYSPDYEFPNIGNTFEILFLLNGDVHFRRIGTLHFETTIVDIIETGNDGFEIRHPAIGYLNLKLKFINNNIILEGYNNDIIPVKILGVNIDVPQLLSINSASANITTMTNAITISPVKYFNGTNIDFSNEGVNNSGSLQIFALNTPLEDTLSLTTATAYYHKTYYRSAFDGGSVSFDIKYSIGSFVNLNIVNPVSNPYIYFFLQTSSKQTLIEFLTGNTGPLVTERDLFIQYLVNRLFSTFVEFVENNNQNKIFIKCICDKLFNVSVTSN